MGEEVTLDRAMRERRSVRHYEDRRVGDETLSEIIEQASWAPSPGNTQAWKVIALSHEVSKEVIRRFELAGWESVFPVLRQVMQSASAGHAAGETGAVREPEGAVDWNARALEAYRTHFEVTGSPRLIFVYRVKDLKRYVNLFGVALSMLLRRSKQKRSPLTALRHFLSSLRNIPTLIRVNALTRTLGLANFTYALTLAAYSRGLSTCIQSNYVNVHRDLRRFLGLGRDVDIVTSVLIGHGDRVSPPPPEIFRTRKPVEVNWIRAHPESAGAQAEPPARPANQPAIGGAQRLQPERFMPD